MIVGARCAGAALAQRLAAAGRSVALLDAAKLPSDQHTSTHLIQPPGMAELDLLGVGDAVRAASPTLRAVRLSYDGNEARLPYRDGGEAHCLRRETLDGFLQQAAVKAGAELRPESKVIDLLRDESGRVEGVVARVGGEATEQLCAPSLSSAQMAEAPRSPSSWARRSTLPTMVLARSTGPIGSARPIGTPTSCRIRLKAPRLGSCSQPTTTSC